MARQVQADESLEQDTPARKCACQKDEKTGGCAAICDHVEHSAELGGLFEAARGHAVEGIEEARDCVEERTAPRVQGHVVE